MAGSTRTSTAAATGPGGTVTLLTGSAASAATAIRPRHSASPPTASHAARTGPIHALPVLDKKRCCASHRKSFAPAHSQLHP